MEQEEALDFDSHLLHLHAAEADEEYDYDPYAEPQEQNEEGKVVEVPLVQAEQPLDAKLSKYKHDLDINDDALNARFPTWMEKQLQRGASRYSHPMA